MTDYELLQGFVQNDAQADFTQLVERHLGLVYSAARRQLGDTPGAEDVVQEVFTLLARKAARLGAETLLPAWLHRTACLVASETLRRERRRQHREQLAMENLNDPTPDAAWAQIEPWLDEALARLSRTDHAAVVLRYFENQSLKDVGVALGASEEAARKRVTRALDRLRAVLVRRGVTTTAAALSAALSVNAVQAAPAGLAGTLAVAAVKGSSVTGSTLTLLKGALKLMAWTKAKTATVVTVGILLAAGTGIVAVNRLEKPGVSAAPDPLKLLESVAKARQRISSGKVEFQVSIYWFERPLDGTNDIRIKAVFKGNKRRLEVDEHEYAYVSMEPDAAAVTEAKRRELGLGQEAAERAGLLRGFDSHHVTAYDGKLIFDYTVTDNKPFQTKIDVPENAGTLMFDPRCLGLRPYLFADSTVDNCLGYSSAESVTLVGREVVDGLAAWHIRVGDRSLLLPGDFWVDASHPIRVVKQEYNGQVVISQFDDAHPTDPIPTEVRTVEYRNGKPLLDQRIIRTTARWNVPVNPVSWTLAGLGMPVGVEVVDYRIQRTIGYWNGTDLSKDLPTTTRQATKPVSLLNPLRLLRLAGQEEKSPLDLEAFRSPWRLLLLVIVWLALVTGIVWLVASVLRSRRR